MNSRAKFLIISIALFALAGSALFFIAPTGSNASTTANLTPIAQTVQARYPTPDVALHPSHSTRTQSTVAEGAPALKPHVNAVAAASNSVATTSSVFTEADIKQYVATHPIARRVTPTSPIIVEKIQYLTKKEVRSILDRGETTFSDSSDNDPMCLVTLGGTFILEGPNGIAVTYQKAFELFDAGTGNLVSSGTGNF
jgi:hypothetical protein